MIDLFTSEAWGVRLAVASSFVYAGTLVTIRAGMRGGTPFAALLTVNSIVALGGLSIAAARGTLFNSSPAPLLWYAAAGVLGQGVGTLTHYTGIERMGVGRSSAIQSSTPLWGAVFAVLALGESPGAAVAAGTVAIVAGVMLLAVPGEGDSKADTKTGWIGSALVFPLVSSVAYAFVPIFAKFAFAHQQTPMLGFGVAFTAGLLNLAGSIFFWTAMVSVDVSVVLPISRLYPLWMLILSAVFLGGMERVTLRIALGGGMIVAGGVLVTAFR